MPALLDFDPPAAVLDLRPGAVNVYRQRSETAWEYLPHVRLLSDSRRMGAEPGGAHFAYVLDDLFAQAMGWPGRIEHVWGGHATSGWVLRPGERIAAYYWPTPNQADVRLLFDGYVMGGQADAGRATEAVTITAAGLPVREWDTVIGGANLQNMDEPTAAAGADGFVNYRATDLPCRFNPDGKPNCGTVDYSLPSSTMAWRVFADAAMSDRDPAVLEHWTLSRAVKYLLAFGCSRQHVAYDLTWPKLDSLLTAWKPLDGVAFNPADPTTYTVEAIRCPDFDATGMAWPDAVQRLVEPHGFTISFRNRIKPDGEPEWQVFVHRRFNDTAPRAFRMAPAGMGYTPAACNVGDLKLAWDVANVEDDWTVDTAPPRYEVSVILLPAFAHAPADADDPTVWAKGGALHDGFTFRVWHASEAGDGYSQPDATWVAEGPGSRLDLAELLNPENAELEQAGEPDAESEDQPRRYVVRRRPAVQRELFARAGASLTDATAPLRQATLHVCVCDDPDDIPAPTLLWAEPTEYPDGWKMQEVTEGGWELCEDRLGIKITTDAPNDWNIGKPPPDVATAPFPDGKVPLVECVADPDPTGPKRYVFLLLTCVIEGDRRLPAGVRPWNSVGPRTVSRRDDGRDTYHRHTITSHSVFNRDDDELAPPIVVRDDTDKARALAVARRTEAETPKVAGTLTVPRLEFGYLLGDRVGSIDGRGIALGAGSQSPEYPVIVGIDRSYAGGFATTFQLEDRRGEGQAGGQAIALEAGRRVAASVAAGLTGIL